ncbi:MAG TPA: hypothetical protein ENJ77_00035, partial [Candidatus Moranbacteria bacterium]|nr:hypothetical protein [Candidatus Moranbacteria bacterium]
MRLKLLFFPVSLIAVIVMAIWYIWPAWQESKDLKKQLQDLQHDYNLLLEREKVIEKLASQLQGSEETKNFLLRYIPFNKDEEYIINAINAVAAESGTGLILVNPAESSKSFFSAKKSDRPAADIPPAGAPTPAVGADGSRLGSVVIKKKPMKEFAVEVVTIGTYEATKKFLSNLNKMDRLHGVMAVSVEAVREDTQLTAEEKEISEQTAAAS